VHADVYRRHDPRAELESEAQNRRYCVPILHTERNPSVKARMDAAITAGRVGHVAVDLNDRKKRTGGHLRKAQAWVVLKANGSLSKPLQHSVAVAAGPDVVVRRDDDLLPSPNAEGSRSALHFADERRARDCTAPHGVL
jgi:hypothetical protein